MEHRRSGGRWVGAACLLLALMSAGCLVAPPDEGIATTEPGASVVGGPNEGVSVTREATVKATQAATATIAPTPTAALSDAAYYLAYGRRTADGSELVFADPGEAGRRAWRVPGIPEGWHLELAGLSPGGEYLAYHTGAVADHDGDLTLHILRLDDGMIIKSIPLVTDDLGNQMRALGEKLAASPPEELDSDYWTAELLAEQGMFALDTGIGSVAWSPDGSVLAFAGQIDGPSSDVYTYDLADDELRRLTDGPTQVQYLDWSPDGRWIAHGSAYWTGAGTYMINNFVTRDGGKVVTRDVGGQHARGWDGSERYVVYNSDNGPGAYRLMGISPELGTVKTLWEWTFDGYALDTANGQLLVNQTNAEWDFGYGRRGPANGTYQVDPATGSMEQIAEMSSWLVRWPREGELGLFYAGEGVEGVSVDGEVRLLLEDEYGYPYPSPDGSRIAFFGYRDPEGILVLDVDSGSTMLLDAPGVTCVSWRPDGEALTFEVDDVLYFNDLRSGRSVVVDDQYDNTYYSCGAKWIEASED